MMNKLRDNTGVVLWILVISFGIIWVLQDSGALDTAGTAVGTNIIVVDGDPIAFEEYQRVLNAQLEQYQAQTGEPMTPQQTDALREQIFQYLVEDKLREQEMERLGITVTDEELVDMIYGEDPHPIIRAYFGNQQGEVDPLLLQNVAENPEYREQLLELENYLRAERRREKLDNLIQATVRVSDADVLEAYERQNRSVDTRFVALRYADVPAEEVELTESDLQSFYDEHRDEFERERTYTLEYVAISKDPTPEDTALVRSELERVRPRFQAAEDDSLFLAQNASERPFTSAYFRADELDENVAEAVFSNLEEGAVVGPVISNDLAHLVKVVDVRPSDEVAVRARHILLRAPEEDEEQREAMRTLALELEERLQQGESFAELAEEYSGDPGSAVRGGDLGWFGPGRMVQPFEEAALGARIGQIVGPVETQYGYHLIEVTGRADEEVQLADYALRVRPDVSTLNRIQERLDDLQYYAEESGNFAAEAERLDLDVQQVQVEADQEFIPGLGTSRAIQNFLSGAEEGDISDVIELDDQFVVLQVEEIQPEGYRPFEEVRAEIEPRARLAEQREIQTARLRSALTDAGGLQALAQAVGAQVRTAENVQFNNPVVPTLGREPKFTGTALGLEEGATSGVVAGENAAFVIETTSVQEPPPITQSQRDQIRAQLLNQRRNMVMQQWLTSLRDQAEVEDYRRRFQQ